MGYTYILFNYENGALYTGVTSDLIRRVRQHKQKTYPGFTTKYDVNKLGYFEVHQSIVEAIKREKQIKNQKRAYKLALINKMNPQWNDLDDGLNVLISEKKFALHIEQESLNAAYAISLSASTRTQGLDSPSPSSRRQTGSKPPPLL